MLFVLVGILGFVADSGGKFLGTFQVSAVHNVVHLLFGAVGLVLARSAVGARMFLTGGGAVYLTLWAVGVIGAGDWISVNTADNWLHFVLGIGMLAVRLCGGAGRYAGCDVTAGVSPCRCA